MNDEQKLKAAAEALITKLNGDKAAPKKLANQFFQLMKTNLDVWGINPLVTKVLAIKYLRDVTGLGLKDTKDLFDYYLEHGINPWQKKSLELEGKIESLNQHNEYLSRELKSRDVEIERLEEEKAKLLQEVKSTAEHLAAQTRETQMFQAKYSELHEAGSRFTMTFMDAVLDPH